MRKRLVFAVLLGGAAAVSAQTHSQPLDSDPRFEETLIVSAGLEEESASRLAASVDVIGEDEILARQTTNVADLLRTVPGLTIVRSGSPGKVTSLFSRGSESDHTLALWNGIELNNPFFGGFDWAFLPTDGVRRVEIVRGPFSAVHGSDALGGVVQVLTGDRNGGSVRIESGEKGYSRVGLDAGLSGESVQVDVAGSLRRGDGEIENDFFDSEEVALSARWSATESLAVSFVARVHESENGIPFSGGVPSSGRQISWSERQLAVPVSYQHGLWDFDGRLSQVSYTTSFRDPEDAFGFTGYDTDSQSERLLVSAARHFADASWIAFGGEVERLEVDDRSVFGTNLDGARQKTESVFAQVTHDLGRMRLDLGVRHDDNDAFGSRTTPKIGLLLSFGKGTKFRASWGEGFRAPSIGELFYPFSGNADLEPEESESWEVGIEQEIGDWKVGATVFDTEFLNLVDFDFVTFTNRNVGSALSQGLEIWSRYSGRLLTIAANATVLETEDLETGESLLRRPDQSASLVIASSPEPWNLSFTASFVGQRRDVDAMTFQRTELDSHLRLDVSGRFERWDRFQPYARVENLADEKYQEVAGYPAPGRRVIAGFASSWR
jgi:vitamin B12 transporter